MGGTSPSGPAGFASPEEAVEAVTRLLQAEDWRTLSRHYDLSGTSIRPETLESGEFFVHPPGSEPAGPPGLSRFRHPFPPGYRYKAHEIAGADAVVTVSIAIDQGDGMVLRGLHRFRMRRSPEGWRLRPEPAI